MMMAPAIFPRSLDACRLIVVDPHRATSTLPALRLVDLLEPGDVVVVNDAATFPGAFHGFLRRVSSPDVDSDSKKSVNLLSARTEPIEVRFAAHPSRNQFRALVFGVGDWHTPTELRPVPSNLRVGDQVVFESASEGEPTGTIAAIDRSGRVVDLVFEVPEDDLWRHLYRAGTPIQYSYMRDALAIWDVQTSYASRPWSFEMPSAGRILNSRALVEFARKGVHLRTVTHAAGISSTGDSALDRSLPWPERFSIPEATVRSIDNAEGRVVAIGTSVVRALEGAYARHQRVAAGEGTTDIRLSRESQLNVVDAIVTGVHDPATSHFELLEAFAPRESIKNALQEATRQSLLGHEFGDFMWLSAWPAHGPNRVGATSLPLRR